jgi:3',5'-cyclic AMP phosphodiesterase CpdA
MSSTGGRADRRRRRRRRQQRRLAAIIGGTVLVLGTVVAVAFAGPPGFLISPEPTPTASRTPPTPTPTPQATTESPPATDELEARIAIAGDTGTRGAAAKATARSMETEDKKGDRPYDALILLGDIIYPTGDSALTRSSITDLFAGTLDSAKLIPALGNHDVQSREQDDILRKLGRDSAWYVEQVGPVRVIALDSNRVGDKRQLAWLRGVLAEKQPPGTWTIAAMHHPAYSAGDHGSTKSVQRLWVPLFEKANVDLVLAGHDHDYQRSKEINGITYIVSGGGAKLRKVGHASFTEVSLSVFHFVDLLVYKDRLEGRAIGHDGQALDTWTIKR